MRLISPARPVAAATSNPQPGRLMNQIGLNTFADLIHDHWLSAFFVLVSLATVCVVLVLRRYVRMRMREMLEKEFGEDHELDFLPPPGALERKALEAIAGMRKQVWQLPESELQLGFDVFNQRALDIVRTIGAIYHPQAGRPEFEASLSDTLELIRRVSSRLARLASTVPVKFIGGRKLSDFQRYYQVYLKINENPVLKLLRSKPHIYKAARFALNMKNVANPLYWAGRELTRESYFLILRWFYLTFTSEIGKEAIRLYSGKRFHHEEDSDAALICYRLFHTMRKWAGPTPAEWAAFVRFVAGHSALDSDSKLHILTRCSEDRLPRDVEERTAVTKSGIKWYRKGLKILLDADAGSSPAKAKLVEMETGGVEVVKGESR